MHAHDTHTHANVHTNTCTVLSRKYAPPPPPIVLMKTTAQVLLSVKTLTVTNNLCNVYKILYYAAVYVRGHFCWHVIIRVSYLQSLYSIVVHGYIVHSVLGSYNYSFSARILYCVRENRKGGVLARSYDKSRDNAPPTLLAYAGLQKRGAYLRDNTVHTHKHTTHIHTQTHTHTRTHTHTHTHTHTCMYIHTC